MSKSIIIFGKGPSVLRCNREIVNQHDDIAICGFPVLNDFFLNLIKEKTILYHFANCGSFDKRYTNKINALLKIQNIINTNTPTNNYKNFLGNDKLITEKSIRSEMLEQFKKYDLDPASGTMSLQYILNKKQYNKITLVGFDNFEIGQQAYYFKPHEYSDEAKRIVRLKLITEIGIINFASGHNTEKTYKYYNDVFKNNSEITFNIISNIKFSNLPENVSKF